LTATPAQVTVPADSVLLPPIVKDLHRWSGGPW